MKQPTPYNIALPKSLIKNLERLSGEIDMSPGEIITVALSEHEDFGWMLLSQEDKDRIIREVEEEKPIRVNVHGETFTAYKAIEIDSKTIQCDGEQEACVECLLDDKSAIFNINDVEVIKGFIMTKDVIKRSGRIKYILILPSEISESEKK